MKKHNLVHTTRRASAAVDTTNPELAFRLTQLARTIRAAKQDVKLDSWDDFVSWWNQNRSQGLLFSLIDALGTENPVIGQMKQIMTEQDALERKLHDVYLQLKGQPAETAPDAPEAEPELEPAAETPEAPEEPAADETAVEDLEDLLKE